MYTHTIFSVGKGVPGKEGTWEGGNLGKGGLGRRELGNEGAWEGGYIYTENH